MATFAIAAILVAILFADKLMDGDELRRRLYQVALGAAVALLAATIAVVAVPVSQDAVSGFQFGDLNSTATRILRERLMVITGAAFLLFTLSIMQSRAFPTLAVGGMFGGLVLLIGIVADLGAGSFTTIYYDFNFDAGAEKKALYAIVVAIGTALLIAYGYNEWDRVEELLEATRPLLVEDGGGVLRRVEQR